MVFNCATDKNPKARTAGDTISAAAASLLVEVAAVASVVAAASRYGKVIRRN